MMQIAYSSHASSGSGPAVPDAILAASRRNNRLVGVTGLLLHNGHGFLQAIEGEPDDIERLFAKIAADPRHHDITDVTRRAVPAREFGVWAMAAHDTSRATSDIRIHGIVSRLVEDVTDAATRARFEAFAGPV